MLREIAATIGVKADYLMENAAAVNASVFSSEHGVHGTMRLPSRQEELAREKRISISRFRS